MASIVVLGCERDGGAWPPVAALTQELSRQGHAVSALCDSPIEYAFKHANVLRIPGEFESTPFVDNLLTTELTHHIERGGTLESFPSPLVTCGG